MIVFLYLLNPEFGISLNRSLDMIKSGSAKGLMMIYYQFGNLAFLFAALTYCLQVLALVFHNNAVQMACTGLFQPLSAKLALTLGGMMALLLAYGFSAGLTRILMISKPLKTRIERWQHFHLKYEYYWVGLIAAVMTAQPGPLYALIYFIGFLNIDLRKIVPAAVVLMLVFL